MTSTDIDALMGEIEWHGWALQYVQQDDPDRCYAYTAGLVRRGVPELVVSGLAPDPAWGVLNSLAARSVAGDPPEPGAVLPGHGEVPDLRVEVLRDTRPLERARMVVADATVLRALHLVPVG